MPLVIILTLLSAACIIHAGMTGRFRPWGFIILIAPGIGALAYVAIELIPEWIGSAKQKAKQRVNQAVGPEKRYRELSDRLEDADTVANRTAVADQCLAIGKFEEARFHYEKILASPMGEAPQYFLGKARAEFSLGQSAAALSDLDELKRRWPDYQSADGHLLYARALESAGRLGEALDEYQALANYYPGAEARVRYALLLKKEGRVGEAQPLLADLVKQMNRAPSYVRKKQSEWIAIAENELRGLKS